MGGSCLSTRTFMLVLVSWGGRKSHYKIFLAADEYKMFEPKPKLRFNPVL